MHRTVLERLPINGHALFALRPFHLFVKATFGFVAEHPAFQHLLEKLGQLQVRALVFYVLAQVRDHVSKYVEPNQIDGAEGG